VMPFAFAAGLIGAGIGYAGWIAGRRTTPPGGAVTA